MQADKNTSIFLKSYDRSKWEKVELSKVGSIITGSTPSRDNPEFWGGDFCWVTAVDFQSKYIFTSEEKLSDQGKKVCRVLPPNTVLVTCIASIGLNAITKCESATNQQINAIVCDTKFYDPEFIYYAIEAYKFDLINLASKTAVPIINKTQFERFCIAAPDLKEQNKIAETLSNIDSHISNLEKLISKQENIKKSTINLLLKPKADWVKKTIGDVCSFFTSSSKSAYIDPDGQYFIVDMGAVSDDGTLIAQKKTNYAHDFLHKDDLIMPKDDIGGGNIIGKAVAIQENNKYILSDHVYKLQTELDATFLSYLINSPKINKYMRAMATGSAQLGISKRTVSKCELCFPADLGQQKQIAQKLSTIDEHISNLKLQLKKQQDLKQGLMQYFFGN